MTKTKQKAALLILVPVLVFSVTLIIWLISIFALGDKASFIIGLAILVIAVFVAAVTAIPCMFFAFKLLSTTKSRELKRLKQNSKYTNLSDAQITYINAGSVSALFSSFVWALGSRMYLWAIGTFVPIFSIYVWVKLIVDGRRLAWEEGNWDSFDAFKQRQEQVAIAVVIVVVATLISTFFFQ